MPAPALPTAAANASPMEVHFTPAAEAQLKQFAANKGKDPKRVVEESVARMLERQMGFTEG